MPWTRYGRHKEALEEPFPQLWRDLLSHRVAHWNMLDEDERLYLEELIRLFLADKKWEPINEFELTDEIRVSIAAMACLLILGLEYESYENVKWIQVQPSSFRHIGRQGTGIPGVAVDLSVELLGSAHFNGPVVIAWDAAADNARHPERGHNVVYHEFAHKLDMDNGVVDGTPNLTDDDTVARWIEVCTAEFEAMRRGEGGELLDPYGAQDPGEFFAVATETFFDRPIELQEQHSDLFDVLAQFYNQDPAERARRNGG